MTTAILDAPVLSSAELAAALGRADVSRCSATVVGYGYMGRRYVQALRRLGVGRIRVCSRSAQPLRELHGQAGLDVVSGGVEQLACVPSDGELAIVATPTAMLATAAERLAALGFQQLLIEKPVCLDADRIEALADHLEQQRVEASCAYNRVGYPGFHELRARARREGGITSCTYTFTEFVQRIVPERYSAEELGRWGIANSLHVMSMAHGLIGMPQTWSAHRAGSLSWHPAGSVFVGSGVSVEGVAFAYHADWGSTGRWSVEVHTAAASYRLCPLEALSCRRAAMEQWQPVPLEAFAPELKAGVAEQVAAMLDPRIRPHVPLPSLRDAARLTRFAESVFGYARSEDA